MFPTSVARSRFQGRRVLRSFRANKDFYKGNRQAALPGGHRTGAPGVHVNHRPGYLLLEDKVRVFVAPPIQDIINCPLKPYVSRRVRIPESQKNGIFRGMPDSGLTPAHFLSAARKYTLEEARMKSAAGQVPRAAEAEQPADAAA
ncbi:hypothetical protein B0H15DRAFT_883869 [Mycena belliarum]|uniref:Mitochondrial ribosomal protein L27 n=1 Tax=Mycena belliarum TaxID=1033014 RepID=A0AAD6UAR7_9AGAR|nr:hypothetical protein B0H15DRAFT_883869 [Mycena belliae]